MPRPIRPLEIGILSEKLGQKEDNFKRSSPLFTLSEASVRTSELSPLLENVPTSFKKSELVLLFLWKPPNFTEIGKNCIKISSYSST